MTKRLFFICLFSLLTVVTAATGESDSTYTSEKLKFSAGFRWFSAGDASMQRTLDTLNGSTVQRITSDTKTNSFLDKFYRVRDRIDVWLDPVSMELLKVDKSIHEGKYKKKHVAVVDTLSRIAIFNSDTLALPGPVIDPISVIYTIRDEDLFIGKTMHFTTYDNGKIRDVYVRVTGIDRVAVPAGIFNCFVVSPSAPDGKPLLKNKGQMKVWIADDEWKTPIRIEQKTNVGTMLLELEEAIYTELEKPRDIIVHDKDEDDQQE